MQWFASQGIECHHGAHREWKNIVSLLHAPRACARDKERSVVGTKATDLDI